MMNNQHTHTFLNTATRLAEALELLDACHTAASNQTLDTLNSRGRADLVAMLREIAYVADETANELQAQADEPVFRLVKGNRQGRVVGIKTDDSSPVADRTNSRPGFRVLVSECTPHPLYVLKRAGG